MDGGTEENVMTHITTARTTTPACTFYQRAKRALGLGMSLAVAFGLPLLSYNPSPATAQGAGTRVVVTIENLAPQQGTFQTPFWVGFHEGSFDTYDGNTPASNDPQPGSVAMERICEDGDTTAITADFAALSLGVDATLTGPLGPIGPGEIATGSFVLDPLSAEMRYFSYASMIIPSNDFCISNGNPQAHRIFDDVGNFVAQDFFVTGLEVLDAGTEINDELPENTAFFGQAAPNTGIDENGLIGDAGDLANFAGFLAADSRIDPPTILGTPQFANGDFTQIGYPMVRIGFAAAPAITQDQTFVSDLSGDNEVPPVATPASGQGTYELTDGGTRLQYAHVLAGLNNVVAAHLHMAPAGANGPIVAVLLAPVAPGGGPLTSIDGVLTTQSLTGPLQGQPLDALIAAIQAGEIYVNIHTNDGIEPPNTGPGDFAPGELRGQLQ